MKSFTPNQFKDHRISDTYYHSSSNIAPVFSELIDRRTADVCVIGGGLTGVSTALNLAEKRIFSNSFRSTSDRIRRFRKKWRTDSPWI